MKKIIALILAVVMVFGMAACAASGTESKAEAKTDAAAETKTEAKAEEKKDDKKEDAASAEEAVEYKERVVIANSATLKKLDPHTNNTSVNGQIYQLTHNSLVDCDYETGEFLPELAESWEQPQDDTYIFHLRNNVDFHNGEHFTAKDVIFTFERGVQTASQKTKLEHIKEMEAIDDYTLRITLDEPNADFFGNLCHPNLCILNEKAISELGDDQGCAIGTGPYVMTEWVPDDYTLVTRNENFWGEKPVTKEIMYRKISEASARVIALQTGEVDIALEVPGIEAPHIADAEGCTLIQMPSTKLVYLALNQSGYDEKLLDLKVRQALNYATNVGDIIIATKEGFAEPANGTIPQGVWGYSDSVSTYSYDIDKAKALLAEAGYADGIDLEFSGDKSIYPGLFEILQAQWAQAGVNLTLSTDDATIITDQDANDTYAVSAKQNSWSFISAIDSLWGIGSASNHTNIADPVLDEMITASQREMDDTKRLALYAEISQYMTDTACMIPLYNEMLLIGVRDGVEGANLYGCGRHSFTYVTAQK